MAIRILIAALAAGSVLFGADIKPAQANIPPGIEVHMILTSADHMNHRPPALKPTDVTVMDAAITDWAPIDAGRDLQLFFLIDDSANYDFGAKLMELRQFINTQPDSVSIGIAYIHNGNLQIAEQPATDHTRAAAVLRAPSGGTTGNPYCTLSDLIQGWNDKSLRHEIVMVTAGIDVSSSGPAVCTNAEAAIRDAERAGVIVYALYNPPADYLSLPWAQVDSGLVNLANVAYESGGEAYFVGHTPALTLEPFLADIAEHLAHQYWITLRLAPRAQAGFQTIFVNPASPDLELMKPDKLWVPASGE